MSEVTPEDHQAAFSCMRQLLGVLHEGRYQSYDSTEEMIQEFVTLVLRMRECGKGQAYQLVSAWCASLEASLRWLCTEETVTITKREYEELLLLRTARRYPPVRQDLPYPSTDWFETNYPGNTA